MKRILIDSPKYGEATPFETIEAAETRLNDLFSDSDIPISLTVRHDGKIFDQDGDEAGREEKETNMTSKRAWTVEIWYYPSDEAAERRENLCSYRHNYATRRAALRMIEDGDKRMGKRFSYAVPCGWQG